MPNSVGNGVTIRAVCSISGDPFLISERERNLLNEFQLPLPIKAPAERWIYAVGQSTPFVFHREICPKTQKPILSRWSENSPMQSVAPEWFWSDACDNTVSGQAFDFSRSFFEQFEEVVRNSFAPSITQVHCENSPYVNSCRYAKDCHLCFACEHLRDCLICILCSKSVDLLLCSGVSKSELCYACLDCSEIYNCRRLQDCKNCIDCYWCIDCIGCRNCFQCFGLRQASDGFYIRNQKVTEAEWKRTMEMLELGSHAAEERNCAEAGAFFAEQPNHATCFHNEDCSQIYQVTNCKNCSGAMYSENCRDCKDLIFSSNCRDCYCIVWTRESERCYYVLGGLQAYDCFFVDGVVNGRNQAYSFCCFNGCNDLFGCYFLKRKSHCILNKQYSPREYFELRSKVIRHMQETGEWGQWFPPSFYATPYAESWAHFFLTELAESQVVQRGLLTKPEASRTGRNARAADFCPPDDIGDFSEAMCESSLYCKTTGREYRISKQELKVLQKQRAPVFRNHWSVELTELQRKSIERCKIALDSYFPDSNYCCSSNPGHDKGGHG